jgi:hypothetical protein
MPLICWLFGFILVWLHDYDLVMPLRMLSFPVVLMLISSYMLCQVSPDLVDVILGQIVINYMNVIFYNVADFHVSPSSSIQIVLEA